MITNKQTKPGILVSFTFYLDLVCEYKYRKKKNTHLSQNQTGRIVEGKRNQL